MNTADALSLRYFPQGELFVVARYEGLVQTILRGG